MSCAVGHVTFAGRSFCAERGAACPVLVEVVLGGEVCGDRSWPDVDASLVLTIFISLPLRGNDVRTVRIVPLYVE